MTKAAISCQGVVKRYPHFTLDHIDLTLNEGTVMGFVGPNGAGKSTTLRIIMGLIAPDGGSVNVLGHDMPAGQIEAKRQIGFVSEDMRLYGSQSIGFHMNFIQRLFDGWDDAYATDLLKRFDLNPDQKVKGLSHGQRVKAALLLVLARRPQLMVFDEPTTGLDPQARHDCVNEMKRAMEEGTKAILFSSHNTYEVEQISNEITFIRSGQIIASQDKDDFLNRWRRVLKNGQPAFVIDDFSAAKEAELKAGGAVIEAMTLEEIFLAAVNQEREAA